MSFDWTEFLTLAEELLQNPDSPGPREASLRSAVSRAYYAAYRFALNFERDRNEYTPSGYATDQIGLVKHFQSSPDRDRRKLGVDIDRLRLNRGQADYNDVLENDPMQLARSSVEKAREVLDALNSLQ